MKHPKVEHEASSQPLEPVVSFGPAVIPASGGADEDETPAGEEGARA